MQLKVKRSIERAMFIAPVVNKCGAHCAHCEWVLNAMKMTLFPNANRIETHPKRIDDVNNRFFVIV